MITAYQLYCSSCYRLNPVKASLCLRLKYPYFYLHTALQEHQYLYDNDNQNDTGIATTEHLLDSHRENLVRIPIAQSSSLTALRIPAVSSLEACQTPTR